MRKGSIDFMVTAGAALALAMIARAARKHHADTFDDHVVERVGVSERGMLYHLGKLAKPHDYVGYCALTAVVPGVRARDRVFVSTATAIAAVIGHTLKKTIPRERPAKNRFTPTGGESFPSTHVAHTTAFGLAMADVADRCLGMKTVPRLAAVGLGGAMALSRVRSAAHWPSDTIAGFLIGVASVGIARELVPR